MQLIQAILNLWKTNNVWDSPALTSVRVGSTVKLAESAIREIQREQRQFDSRVLKEMSIPQPSRMRELDIYPRAHVDAFEVYARPARDYLEAVESGADEEAAFQAFEKRLKGIVQADMVIAARDEQLRFFDQLVEDGIALDLDSLPEYDDDNPSELPEREELETYLDLSLIHI